MSAVQVTVEQVRVRDGSLKQGAVFWAAVADQVRCYVAERLAVSADSVFDREPVIVSGSMIFRAHDVWVQQAAALSETRDRLQQELDRMRWRQNHLAGKLAALERRIVELATAPPPGLAVVCDDDGEAD